MSMKWSLPAVRTSALAGMLLLGMLVLAPAMAASDTSAQSKVARLHDTLLQSMRESSQLGFNGRAELIGPVVSELFDIPLISRIVTGKYWKSLSAEQQGQFIDVFGRLTTATYASRFDNYGGERFETTGVDEKRGGYVVSAQIVLVEKDPVDLKYVLRESDGELRIINVVAKGVSDLALKKADYKAILDSKGFDSLINQLSAKIGELESQTQ